MSYTCPVCGRTSHHPEDEKNRYCSACARFEERLCEDCGDQPGLSGEDGLFICNDCAILRAKKWQMDEERRRER